jgi:hypothetical protein
LIKYESIREKLRAISSGIDNEEFLYSFLRSFDFPEATISRIRLKCKSDYAGQEILIKNKLIFITTNKSNLRAQFEELKFLGISSISTRFILIVNDKFMFGFDRISEDSLSSSKKNLYNHVDFFLPLVGIEKSNTSDHKTADLKAAEKLAELYNILFEHNCNTNDPMIEGLNIMMARLLFCFYADSIGLIENGTIHNLISRYSDISGDDLKPLFEKIFFVLSGKDREDLSSNFESLPVINISLFEEDVVVPSFNRVSRKVLLEISALNWVSLNPDILGSLIQSVIVPEGSLGLSNHYTSAANIMKVLGPLFLDEYYEIFENSRHDLDGLQRLLERIKTTTVLDPICGAGNFLIVAFKELIKLEVEIKEAISSITNKKFDISPMVSVDQFYGIEPNHFKAHITRIGLWVAFFQSIESHQVNETYLLDTFNKSNIVWANPTRISWGRFCIPKSEVFIVCNPTYKGSRKQSKEQKEDVAFVFREYEGVKNLDYASCWLYLSALFIQQNKSRAAIVVTNSMTQGEQVGLIWPKIYKLDVEISFAHTSFKWRNNSRGNTGVTVVIIGLAKKDRGLTKKIFYQTSINETSNITPYLTPGNNNIIVCKRRSPISDLPAMPKGNMPYDGGNLILSKDKMMELVNDYPESKLFIKRFMGSQEFIQDIERWCLWINDETLHKAMAIPPIRERIERVRENRLNNSDVAARRLADRPYQFRETNVTSTESIIIPSVSSERREYVPIGFVGSDTIISNLAFAIYDCSPWVFGVITSRIHLIWIQAVCGSLETRNRYSSTLGYNTFPFPKISVSKKDAIERCVFSIIEARENNSEKSMAQMYDPDHMDDDLLNAHRVLDAAIESCYRNDPFVSDQQRLEYLFLEYQKQS